MIREYRLQYNDTTKEYRIMYQTPERAGWHHYTDGNHGYFKNKMTAEGILSDLREASDTNFYRQQDSNWSFVNED